MTSQPDPKGRTKITTVEAYRRADGADSGRGPAKREWQQLANILKMEASKRKRKERKLRDQTKGKGERRRERVWWRERIQGTSSHKRDTPGLSRVGKLVSMVGAE
jgi:hypothetical protein